MRYVWTSQAHGKAQFHAFKHVHASTNGLLLGVRKGDSTILTDCIPLFHTFTLPAMLKVACSLVEEYCKTLSPAPEIVGFYQAFTEDGATMQANSVPDIVSQKIKANTGHASVWVFKPESQEFVGAVPGARSGDFSRIPEEQVVQSSEVRKAVREMIEKMKYVEVMDFDDHFHDVSADWTNSALNEIFQTVDRSITA
jgi:hypothetical protein